MVFGLNWYSVRITVMFCVSCADAVDTVSACSASSPAILANGNERERSRLSVIFPDMVQTSCPTLILGLCAGDRCSTYRFGARTPIAPGRVIESSLATPHSQKEL